MSDWKEILKAVAPVVGGALSGPMGSVATKFIASELLGDENASEDAIAAAVANIAPSNIASLQKLDERYKIMMEQTTVRHANDMKSDSWLAKNIRPMALIFMTVNVITLAYFSIFTVLTIEQNKTLDMWLGVFLPVLMVMYAFYFGGRTIEKIKATKLF